MKKTLAQFAFNPLYSMEFHFHRAENPKFWFSVHLFRLAESIPKLAQVTSNLSPILWTTSSFKMKRNVTYPRKKLGKLGKQMENLTSKQKSSSKCWMTLRFSNKLWNIHNMQKIHFRPSALMLKIKCYWKQEWIPKIINHH